MATPMKKTMLKEYWDCGVSECDVYHETKDRAARCIEKDRKSKEWAETKNQRDSARNVMGRDIVKMRKAGFTRKQIAEKHGKSAERIRQIEAKYLREKRQRDIADASLSLDISDTDISEIPIEYFAAKTRLSVRTYNCLRNARVEKLGDVLTMSKKDLVRTKNFGNKSLVELESAINQIKLRSAK